jgi:hypothetical protein
MTPDIVVPTRRLDGLGAAAPGQVQGAGDTDVAVVVRVGQTGCAADVDAHRRVPQLVPPNRPRVPRHPDARVRAAEEAEAAPRVGILQAPARHLQQQRNAVPAGSPYLRHFALSVIGVPAGRKRPLARQARRPVERAERLPRRRPTRVSDGARSGSCILQKIHLAIHQGWQ